MRRSHLIILTAVVVAVIAYLYGPDLIGYLVQGSTQPQGETDLRFSEIPTDFIHKSDFDVALPFMALSAIDMDGDGVDEIFVGGGAGQQDALLKYTGQALTVVSSDDWFLKDSEDASYGAASIDATGDGLSDLFIARDSGLYLYENTGTGFAGRPIDFPLDSKSMPLSVALGDLNGDGAVDVYVSNYIRPEFVEGETIFNDEYGAISNLLLNNGDNTFTDITKSAGVYEQHNTFTAMFVDLNANGQSDLVVAQDTGVPRIFRNNGDLTFTGVDLPVTYSYPMGIAVSDYNNDGRPDLYFSNVGNTLPDFLVRGDLKKDQQLNKDYILLENEGDFVFKDVARTRNVANYGFGWGVVSYDFNNDALADYLITQNYIRFPGVKHLELYAGNLLQQNRDGRFYPVEKVAGIENRKFGVTTVVTDFNDDGWPDAVIGNLDGRLRAFMNAGSNRHWLKVRFPDVVASIGAIATLTVDDTTTYRHQFYASEGLGSDQTRDLFFGLGDRTAARSLEIAFQNGVILVVSNPGIDTRIDVDELQ